MNLISTLAFVDFRSTFSGVNKTNIVIHTILASQQNLRNEPPNKSVQIEIFDYQNLL